MTNQECVTAKKGTKVDNYNAYFNNALSIVAEALQKANKSMMANTIAGYSLAETVREFVSTATDKQASASEQQQLMEADNSRMQAVQNIGDAVSSAASMAADFKAGGDLMKEADTAGKAAENAEGNRKILNEKFSKEGGTDVLKDANGRAFSPEEKTALKEALKRRNLSEKDALEGDVKASVAGRDVTAKVEDVLGHMDEEEKTKMIRDASKESSRNRTLQNSKSTEVNFKVDMWKKGIDALNKISFQMGTNFKIADNRTKEGFDRYQEASLTATNQLSQATLSSFEQSAETYIQSASGLEQFISQMLAASGSKG